MRAAAVITGLCVLGAGAYAIGENITGGWTAAFFGTVLTIGGLAWRAA